MPTDEQRTRELIAYVTGYDSRNMEVQALREALSRTAGVLQSTINASGDLSEDDRVRFAGETEYATLGSVLDEANAALAGGETGEAE